MLVAIAIPIFNTQLERSRDATTASNIRAAYAEASAAYLTEDDSAANVTISGDEVTVANVVFKSKKEGLSDMDNEFAFSVANSAKEGGNAYIAKTNSPGTYSL